MPVPIVEICDVSVDHAQLRALKGKPPAMRRVKLGRKAPSPSKLKQCVRLGDYLGDVPPPPKSKSWITELGRVSIKEVYGNDQQGDCVIASQLHGISLSSENEVNKAMLSTTNEALHEYHRLCGPGDDGCVITDVMDQVISGGIAISGKRAKIAGYAAVDPSQSDAVRTAILVFGGGFRIGFNVPAEWMGSNTYDGAVWDTPSRLSFIGGHDIRAVGFTEQGVQFATWGIVITMTWRALADSRIVDEAFVEMQDSWDSLGRAPSGFDVAGLAAAIVEFNSGQTPPWSNGDDPPPPVPPSPPSPPPPTFPDLRITLQGMEGGMFGRTITLTGTATPMATGLKENCIDMNAMQIPAEHHERIFQLASRWLGDANRALIGLPLKLQAGCITATGLTPDQWAKLAQLLLAAILAALNIIQHS